MKRVISSVVSQRKIVLFIALIVMAFGFFNYWIMPKQENPQIKISGAIVTTIYPGASPEDVEQLVTKKIEDAASEISGYDKVSSESGKNVSIVIVFYNTDADIDKSNRELREKIDEVRAQLPVGCNDPEINTNIGEVAGVMLSLSGDHYSYEQLSDYAEEIKKEIGKVDGIYKTELIGEVEKQVLVKADIDRINQLGFSLQEINNMLYAQNLEIPNGALENEEGKFFVKVETKYQTLGDIKNLILGASKETGGLVRLSDVADVEMTLEDDVVKCKQSDKNAVVVTGYFKENHNIVPVGKEVREKLKILQEDLPQDLEITEVSFQSDDVQKSINDFISNFFEGILLVVAVIFMGMGLRNALVISLSIPLTIAVTFILMNGSGVQLESMSLAGLIIALGMIVDNAVVINDAIEVRYTSGEDQMSASINATRSVAAPVFTSTLTTVAAFVPLLFIPGEVGEFVSSMPKTVIFALIASFFTAIFVVPPLLSMTIKREKRTAKEMGRLKGIREGLLRLLKLALMRRKMTLGIFLVAWILAVVTMTPHLNVAFFPKADKDIMYIDTVVEKVGDLNHTEKIADDVSRLMLEEPEVINITSGIGTAMPRIYLTMDVLFDQDNCTRALLHFDLNKSDRFKTKDELSVYLQEKLDSKIIGAISTIKMMKLADPENAAVGIRLYGEELNRLKEISVQMEEVLENIEGTININSDASESTYEYLVDVDEDKAFMAGILNIDVQKEVQTALFGSEDAVYRKEGKEYAIQLKSGIGEIHQLENLKIKSSITGKKVLLKQIADIKLKPQIDSVKRYNKERSVLVSCDVRPGYSPVDVENEMENEIIPKMDLEGVNLVFEGERENINKNFSNLTILGVFILFFLYMILLIEFKSFLEPLLILVPVPLSLVGSMLGLLLFNKPLSFTAMLGIISLMGIVVNNAILLIDYIKEITKQGYSNEEACFKAVEMRFRPIVLTTVTTLMGLVPLAFSKSELFSPMAVALMSGLLIATLLTMIVIPTIYVFSDNIREKLKHKRKM